MAEIRHREAGEGRTDGDGGGGTPEPPPNLPVPSPGVPLVLAGKKWTEGEWRWALDHGTHQSTMFSWGRV